MKNKKQKTHYSYNVGDYVIMNSEMWEGKIGLILNKDDEDTMSEPVYYILIQTFPQPGWFSTASIERKLEP